MYSKRNKYLPKVDDIEFCVNAFNKSRVISQNPKWELPDKSLLFSTPQYQVLRLQELQQKLFECKSQLNTFKSEEWRLHTKKRNLVASLMYTIRSNNSAELFIQSWPKLWEILYKYKLVPEGIEQLKSVHLCEAPGAFISALNHFLKQNRKDVSLDWLATSLNPYFEDFDPAQVINDDRIIRHTIDRWVFGPDNSGNLFDPQLVEELKKRSEGGEVLLVTADGSQENITSHELVVLDLLMAEALAALKVLSKGGHFVLKIFTVFECPTINMVYLLCSAFDEVHLFKPVSSREATSEAYLVCKGYRFGRDDAAFQEYLRTIEELQKDEKKKDFSLFPSELIAKEFQKQILEAMRYFVAMQEEVINANISSFPVNIYVHEWNRRKFIREEIEKRFFKAYPLNNLAEDDRLCPYVEAQLELYEVDNAYRGSWEEEVIKVQMTNDELKGQMREEFQIIKYSFKWPSGNPELAIQWTEQEQDEKYGDLVKIVRGGKIENIRNSRFITKKLLNFFHKVLELDFGTLATLVTVRDGVTVQDGVMVHGNVQVVLPLTHLFKSLRLHEKLFVDEILLCLKKVTKTIDLIFTNVLFAGQRSVGLVYLMSKLLHGTETEIKLTVRGGFVVSNLTAVNAVKLVEELEKWQPLMDDASIHGFVDIKRLRENRFYDLIKIFNVFSCVWICEKLLEGKREDSN